jgi:hypothetical protein
MSTLMYVTVLLKKNFSARYCFNVVDWIAGGAAIFMC